MNDFVSTESGGTLELVDALNVGVDRDERTGKFYVRVVAIGHNDVVRVSTHDTWEAACKVAHEVSMRAQKAQGRIK